MSPSIFVLFNSKNVNYAFVGTSTCWPTLTPAAPRQRFAPDPYSIRLDVDFCDLDAMVHVNNTVYFRWFETLRVRQFSQDIYPEFSFTPVGKKPVISETWCRYRRPIELYDTVVVGCRVLDLDQPRGEFKQEYAVWSEKQSTVDAVGGCTIVVCDFDLDGGPRTPIPDEWIPKLMKLH